MPAALKAGASLSYPVAPSWASGRIGGGHTLSLLPVVSAGLYRLRASLCRWAALGHSQSVWCAHSLLREAGVLLVVGAFVHSQSALRTHRMVGSRGIGSALCLRRASASAGSVFSVRPFQCLLSSLFGCTSGLPRVQVGGPAPAPCLLWQHGWVHLCPSQWLRPEWFGRGWWCFGRGRAACY